MGKSTLMAKLMLARWLQQFNKIYIVCPTYAEDKVWGPLDEYVNKGRIVVLDSVNENQLKKIWNDARDKKRKGVEQHILIYFDDCGGQTGFKKIGEDGIINQLTTKGNHSNISTIYVVQRIVFCSPTMRINAECVLSFYMQTASERKRLFEEYGIGTFRSFSKMMEESTSQPYHSFLINRHGPGKCSYYHNFKLIKNPEDIDDKKNKRRRYP